MYFNDIFKFERNECLRSHQVGQRLKTVGELILCSRLTTEVDLVCHKDGALVVTMMLREWKRYLQS